MKELIDQEYQLAKYVIRNCKRTCNEETFFAALSDRINGHIDQLFLDGLMHAGSTVACTPGCYYCCHLKVDTHAHEVIRIVEYLESTYSPAEIQNILFRARKNREKIVPMTLQQHYGANLPCCLLSKDKCMAYPVRPIACRSFHAQRVQTCKKSFDYPSRMDLPGSWVNEIKLVLAVANGSLVNALQNEGHDSRAYDLNSSIFEAFNDKARKERWFSGKFSFSDEALAKI